MITYRLRATCLCPNGGGRDHYDVEIVAHLADMILVEDIRAFFDGEANVPQYQEALAAKAATALGAKVTIAGDHPAPISITVTDDPAGG